MEDRKRQAKQLNYLVMDYLAKTEYGYDNFQDVVDSHPDLADELGNRVYKMSLPDKRVIEKKAL